MGDRAVIALPGPSLDFADIADDIPIICVNLALYWAPRCDFWVCVENPNPIHFKCEGAYAETLPLVITTAENRDSIRWQEFIQTRGDISSCKFEPKWLEDAHGVALNSKLMAICFAIQNGIIDIELRGCDMDGTGYKALPEGEELAIKGTEKEWGRRWEYERVQLSNMAEACEDNGVLLTWAVDY